MVGNAVYWLTIIVAMFILPSFVGFETTALVAAGVMLLAANDFRLGDYIEIPMM
jgi:hypothetical protein